MGKVSLSSAQQAERLQISPEFVRISMAAAIELGLKPGRLYRDVRCGCINLLQNYPEGCYANCTYCGLARERPGMPEDNSFIRVAWPVYSTALIADRIAAREAEAGVGRVCISQVQDHRSNADLIIMTRQIRAAAPAVPVSALVNATSITEEILFALQGLGVSNIGFGLDAATEDLFEVTRGRRARGPHSWEQHWECILAARRIFGPSSVNCHVIVGLGETDSDVIRLLFLLRSRQIEAYLFSFNPEPGTSMQGVPRQPLRRHRRVQLAKHLIETMEISIDLFSFDPLGNLAGIDLPEEVLAGAIETGAAFMTDGCPDRHGVMSCNRPYGSYRPGEDFRDYPFSPSREDLAIIRQQLEIQGLLPTPVER
jgi:biotin synthase-related radical SAM superfamily protein